MAGTEYTCALCGETFNKAISDSEAMAEAREFFPDSAPDDMDIVCDDCWQTIKPDAPIYVGGHIPLPSISGAATDIMERLAREMFGAFGVPAHLLGKAGTTTVTAEQVTISAKEVLQNVRDFLNSGTMHATLVRAGEMMSIELPSMRAGAMPIFYSTFITRETEERLFPASRHRSARIRKKLMKRHGGEYRQVPTIYQAGGTIYAHPSFRAEIERTTGDVARPASPTPDNNAKDHP